MRPARVFLPPGLEVVDDMLSGSEKKLIFVSVWFAYTVALFLLNRFKKFNIYLVEDY